jgi:hypothetical protein
LSSLAQAQDDPRPQSPQELIEAYMACYDAQTQRFSQERLLAICSDDSRLMLFPKLGGMVQRVLFKAPDRGAEVDAILTRHGLDPATQPLQGGDTLSQEELRELFFDPERMVSHVRTLLADVEDPRALLAELFRFCARHQAVPDMQPTSIDELTVDGSRAQGVLHERRSDPDGSTITGSMPFHMVQEDGRWTYDLVALAKSMAAAMQQSR